MGHVHRRGSGLHPGLLPLYIVLVTNNVPSLLFQVSCPLGSHSQWPYTLILSLLKCIHVKKLIKNKTWETVSEDDSLNPQMHAKLFTGPFTLFLKHLLSTYWVQVVIQRSLRAVQNAKASQRLGTKEGTECWLQVVGLWHALILVGVSWSRKGHLIPVFLPGESHGWETWRAAVYRVTKEMDKTATKQQQEVWLSQKPQHCWLEVFAMDWWCLGRYLAETSQQLAEEKIVFPNLQISRLSLRKVRSFSKRHIIKRGITKLSDSQVLSHSLNFNVHATVLGFWAR